LIRKRHKKPSKWLREQFGHTPLSVEEKIPWRCRRLVIGTGTYGRLPVMEELKDVEHIIESGPDEMTEEQAKRIIEIYSQLPEEVKAKK
jgi:hypothetical protein